MDKIRRQRRKEINTLGMVVETNKMIRQLFVCDNGVMNLLPVPIYVILLLNVILSVCVFRNNLLNSFFLKKCYRILGFAESDFDWLRHT